MEYIIEKWTIKKLLEVLESGGLNLNPPYQRNPIWTKNTQKYLIYSIKKGIPIPNIFLHLIAKDQYNMVDGQQRTRAIKLYRSTIEIDISDDDSVYKSGKFLNYEIPITIITKVEEDESIEEFYYMVNTSGIKLNRPEENKAHYFNKNFLKLVESITIDERFQVLNIIPAVSQKRMMDRELVEELSSLILYGITDKKTQVDKIYEVDISASDSKLVYEKFFDILNHLIRFNSIHPIKNSRYRQRNDFYTLFGFIKDNMSLPGTSLDYIYKLLLQLERGIRPSKSACQILADYAFNCVSQSNSLKARSSRIEIMNNLFLNETDEPNEAQINVYEFYPSTETYFRKIEKHLMFDLDILKIAIENKEQSQII